MRISEIISVNILKQLYRVKLQIFYYNLFSLILVRFTCLKYDGYEAMRGKRFRAFQSIQKLKQVGACAEI